MMKTNSSANEQATPAAVKDGLTFFPIPEFDKLTQAFGCGVECYFNRNNLPRVPKKYEDMAQSLFFSGGKLPEMSSKVDLEKAYGAIRAWLCSFAPAHEAKITTAAYAIWVWCESAETKAQA